MKRFTHSIAVVLMAFAAFAACEKDPAGDKGTEQDGDGNTLEVGVDLGLTVRWADHNVGATAPEEAGNLYGWGETHTKDDYCWDKYSWATNMMMTKYNTSSGYGSVIDNKTTLESADDVATVEMGEQWRMPTKEDFAELISGCTWTWVDEGTKKGYTITSKVNSNSIFLPAAGMQNGKQPQDVGTSGLYWSSTLDTGSPNSAARILFYSNNLIFTGSDSRYYGASIRAVAVKKGSGTAQSQ